MAKSVDNYFLSNVSFFKDLFIYFSGRGGESEREGEKY